MRDISAYWEDVAQGKWKEGESFLGLKKSDMEVLSEDQMRGFFAALSCKRCNAASDDLVRIFMRIFAVTVRIHSFCDRPFELIVHIDRPEHTPKLDPRALKLVEQVFVPVCYGILFLDIHGPVVMDRSIIGEVQIV